MGNYKFNESEPRKEILDRARISADLKTEKKIQIFGLGIVFIVLLVYVFLIVSADFLNLYSVAAGCLLVAVFAFVLYDVISCYIKVIKGKYTVEIDTVIAIEYNMRARMVNGRLLEDFVRFRNSGEYPINKVNYAVLGKVEVGDTYYVVRYEKKFGKRTPEGLYSTKKYELKEEKD